MADSLPRTDDVTRCPWCLGHDLYVAYHDEEWGVPSHDERHLFEMLLLEGQQAGLSWLTILKKREAYRAAFAGFDPEAIARFDGSDIDRLLADPGIVRNRAKVQAAVGNARSFVALREEVGSVSEWLWDFVGGAPLVNRPRFLDDVPAETHVSRRLSQALKQRGFRFVGPTICYAFMQAVGMVDDHLAGCFRAAARG